MNMQNIHTKPRPPHTEFVYGLLSPVKYVAHVKVYVCVCMRYDLE